jgi:hypothetical protein
MAYISYGQNTSGGKQVAESLFELLRVINEFKNNSGWIAEIGPSNLVDHPDFMVGTGEGQAFNDTYLTLSAALQTFLTADSNANTNRIASLYRGG